MKLIAISTVPFSSQIKESNPLFREVVMVQLLSLYSYRL